MGLGCNAAGVTGCRIIDSPRERMIAILTNVLMPCNGRLPLILFALGCLGMSGFASVLGVAAVFLLAVGMTCAASAILSKTVLRGEPSSFTLELPPYRIPLVGQTLVRSLLDRTVFVLGRAVTAAAPCGLFLWLAERIPVGEGNLTAFLQGIFDPIGRFAGMDGRLIAAFLFALPANELMLPLALAGADGTASAAEVFALRGWGAETIVCMTLFMMFHYPCATTLMTIHKETGSRGWTLFAAVFPTVIGYGLCVLVHHAGMVFG